MMASGREGSLKEVLVHRRSSSFSGDDGPTADTGPPQVAPLPPCRQCRQSVSRTPSTPPSSSSSGPRAFERLPGCCMPTCLHPAGAAGCGRPSALKAV